MTYTLSDRLLRRETGYSNRPFQVNGLYGDQSFVDNLDIVDELKGHNGCVNALSWAKSGRLLASGSDDKVVNIYSYLPEHSSSQFTLTTQIDTGHSHNIFSVKFMPQSNDSKIVTCAGDDEIRVFDIERSARSSTTKRSLDMTSARGKVFRSHSSSVKRIVTEASPFYFLTCSEDGQVRQWDIRQDSSYYPRQTSSFRSLTNGTTSGQRNEAPPPLISYSDYKIELYTISCSPSQPHYIALGGTHVHCFLHDRRMMGRDRLKERGGRLAMSLGADASSSQLAEATQCVAKFAPHGQPRMNRSESKTITACKLGTANPNELVVSWMGDHIYSFNISKSQSEAQLKAYTTELEAVKSEDSSSFRKRKRIPTADSPSAGSNSRTRTIDSDDNDLSRPEVSISLQLSNGESIELPINSRNVQLPETIEPNEGEDTGTPHAQRVRALKNYLSRTHFGHDEEDHRDEMQNILSSSKKALEHIDLHIAQRTYPITGSSGVIDYEKKLRSDRTKVWRFAQSSGVLARVLLGPGQVSPGETEAVFRHFDIIRPAPREGSMPLDRHEQFGYDFAKAILLWLESGAGSVLREFSPESRYANAGTRSRFPVSRDAEINAIDTELIPYLEKLATDLPIVYSGHGGGTGDDPRQTDTIFESEKGAVRAFAAAMKHPFEDLQSSEPKRKNKPAPCEPSESDEENGEWVTLEDGSAVFVPEDDEDQDSSPSDDSVTSTKQALFTHRRAAIKFWGHRVCMAILNRAAIDVNFPFVATAFGNSHITQRKVRPASAIDSMSRVPATVRENHEESTQSYQTTALADLLDTSSDDADYEFDDDEEEDVVARHLAAEMQEDSEDEHVDDDDSSSDGYGAPSKPRYAAARNVPCYSHVRSYQGHCNVETTKDVNFYGLLDEYVVSGSDCSNFFIWEKKTGRLINILNGDCDVVNVVQPHPYEPMLAVSGIDSTVKIFSPDHRARRAAAKAYGVTAADPSTFTSIGLHEGRRRGPNNATSAAQEQNNHSESIFVQDATDLADLDELAEVPISDRGLTSRKRMDQMYEITSRNDMERRTGMQHSYVSRTMLELLQSRIGSHINAEDLNGDDNCVVM